MAKAQILLVEDDPVIGEAITQQLVRLGYGLLSVLSSRAEALERVQELKPDLVIFDMELEGGEDNIVVARALQDKRDVPFVLITVSYSDRMLHHAKASSTFAFLIKPVEESDLKAALAVALHKHAGESKFRKSFAWMSTALSLHEEGLIVTDPHGRVAFLNDKFESLTGWRKEEVLCKPIHELLHFEMYGTPMLSGGDVSHVSHGVIELRDGSEKSVTLRASHIMDRKGAVHGLWITFSTTENARSHLEDTTGRVDNIEPDSIPEAPRQAIGIILASDDRLVILGFRQALLRSPEFKVEADTSDPNQLTRLISDLPHALLVIDPAFHTVEQEDFVLHMRNQHPKLRILLLCTVTDRVLAMNAIGRSISCYLTSSQPAELFHALREVTAGHQYISSQLAEGVTSSLGNLSSRPLHEALSTREVNVFQLIVAGKSVKEISVELHISPKTVSTYRGRLLKKMRMHSTAELVSYALKNGILR